jgi:hypothetical protein
LHLRPEPPGRAPLEQPLRVPVPKALDHDA